MQDHLGSVDPGPLGPALAAARAPLLRVDPYAQYASGWWVRPLWGLHAGNENPADLSLASCIEHDGQTDRSMSYLLACPALGLGVVALTNAGQGPDQGLWWRFHNGLVHAVLGTPPGTFDPDPVIRYATIIMLGGPLLLALALAAQVRAVRRRRHVIAWSAPTVLLGVGALWLGYVYAPGQADGGPVHAMWSTVPDLAMSTIVETLLAPSPPLSSWAAPYDDHARAGARALAHLNARPGSESSASTRYPQPRGRGPGRQDSTPPDPLLAGFARLADIAGALTRQLTTRGVRGRRRILAP